MADMNQIKTNLNVSNKSFDANSSDVESFSILDSGLNTSQKSDSESSQAAFNFFYGNYNNDTLITQSPKIGMNVNELLESKNVSNDFSSEVSSNNTNFNFDDNLNLSTNSSNSVNLVTNTTPVKMNVDSLLSANNNVVENKLSDIDNIQHDSKSNVDMDKFLGFK